LPALANLTLSRTPVCDVAPLASLTKLKGIMLAPHQDALIQNTF
jgi:hypothetical protein